MFIKGLLNIDGKETTDKKSTIPGSHYVVLSVVSALDIGRLSLHYLHPLGSQFSSCSVILPSFLFLFFFKRFLFPLPSLFFLYFRFSIKEFEFFFYSYG